MKKLFALLIVLSLSLLASDSGVITLGTLSATGQTSGLNVSPKAYRHTVQVVVAGSPDTCSIQLEGTLDDVSGSPNWFNLSGSQTCTSSVMFHVVDKPVRGVRVNLTALTGGTNPSVAVKYLGVQ